MKPIFNKLIAIAALCLLNYLAIAQKVVSLTTGVYVSNGWQPKILPSTDDIWTVNTPNDPPNVFNAVPISNGILVHTGLPYPNLPTPGPQFISPAITSQNQLQFTNPGVYLYRRTFELNTCEFLTTGCTAPQQINAILNLRFVGGDNRITWMKINNHFIFPSTILFPNGWTFANWGINQVYSVPLSAFVNGTNEIIVETWNQERQTGIIIDGDLTIPTNMSSVKIVGGNGTQVSSSCISDIAYIDASTLYGQGPFTVDITGPVNLSQVFSSTQNWININKIFSSQGIPIQPGQYSIKISVNGCNSKTFNFEFTCCNEPDASFTLNSNNGYALSGSAVSTLPGTHQWHTYSTPYVHTGAYTPIWTGDLWHNTGSSFNKDLTYPPNSLCYYVRHTVTNACGSDCVSQSVCFTGCDVGECILTAPTNLQKNNGVITWDIDPSAAYYVLEIDPCDPVCCPNAGNGNVDGGIFHCNNGGVSDANALSRLVPVKAYTNSYTMNVQNFLAPGAPPNDLAYIIGCFKLYVYKICPNGQRSKAASICYP